MINLQTFESFLGGQGKDLYDDAIFWFDKLEPEEMCFLLLWSETKTQGIKTESDGYVSDPYTSGSGSGEKQISYKFSSGEAELFIGFSFSGEFTRSYRATYDSPSGGGEFYIDHIKIDAFDLSLEVEGESQVFDFLPKIKTMKYGEEIHRLCEKNAENKIGTDSRLKIGPVTFPEELKEKIEKLRSELPADLKKGFSLVKKMGLNRDI